jgi:hypothetical protein
MKNNYLTLILLFLTMSLYGQNLNFGFVLGGNANSMYGDGSTDFNSPDASGYDINLYNGLYLDYSFSNKLGIKSDLIYTDNKLGTTNDSGTLKMNFIVFTPNLKYSFNDEYFKGFYLIGGPKVSILTSAKLDGIDVKEIFNSTSFGAQLGVGNNLNNYLSVEGKFDAGLSNILSDDSDKVNFIAFILTLNVNLNALIK